ncbi:MAG TPA: sialate O-acetylesterase [Bacteroidales bacterium]|nr:sialate O-acetylesterase [Bacteroidales bacterium]
MLYGLFLVIQFNCQSLSAKLTMPVLFSDNMVLQQRCMAPFWGRTNPETTVSVQTSWNGKTYSTVADKFGNWMLRVETQSAGGPFQVKVSADEILMLRNVMIGEVWLCSGQSNMEMPLEGWGQVDHFQKEIAQANHPNIRLFQVEKATALSPTSELKVMGGSWLICSPKTIPDFSATAYFFALNLSKELNGIPIGLLHTSWGGTPAEAWTSREALENLPEYTNYLSELKKVPTDPTEQKKYLEQQQKNWNDQLINKDRGNLNGIPVWIQSGVDDSDWKTMKVPQAWEEQMLKDFDGVVWFRKTVDIPAEMAGKELTINLGTVDDNEITYFNGQPVGQTEGYDRIRKYVIPADLVKAGRNIVSVRVFDSGGGGGFYGAADQVSISTTTASISLSGDWKYRIGLNLNELIAPKIVQNQSQPSNLFNAMIYPIVPYAFQGAIWYQGEANADHAALYKRLFPLMILDWRKQWNTNFPFYFVQLANFMKKEQQPEESQWAELREAQRNTTNLDRTGMAVIIDIGDADNIHPKNKQEVGRRLSLLALSDTYKKQLTATGPQYVSYKIVGKGIEIQFKSISKGLMTSDKSELRGFSIAGPDQKYLKAKAIIKGNVVYVSSPQVHFPLSVRYGWANNPDCNLINSEGLPASPFSTDY